MGGSVSKIMGKIFGSKEMRLLMLGLDAAGKTSKFRSLVYHRMPAQAQTDGEWSIAILYKLKLNSDVTTIPTVGFNVETVTYKNVKFNVWDVGGQDKIRPLWRHYFSGMARSIHAEEMVPERCMADWEHLHRNTRSHLRHRLKRPIKDRRGGERAT